MTSLSLRPYQAEAVDALRDNVRKGVRRQVLCMPTGSGKTVVAMALIAAALRQGSRAYFAADRLSLVEQTSARFHEFGIPHGILRDKKRSRRLWEDALICSSQTLEARGFAFERPAVGIFEYGAPAPDPDLLVIDECDEIRQRLIKYVIDRDILTLGLSATPFSKGIGGIYETVVNVTTTTELIASEDLVPVTVVAPPRVQVEVDGCRLKANGEWDEEDLSERVMQITGDVVTEWVKHTASYFGGPVPTIGFFPTVADATDAAERFQRAGHDFRVISYWNTPELNQAQIEAFREGKHVGLLSCVALCLDDQTEILTTDGWVGIDDMTRQHQVASYHPTDGAITFHKPSEIVRERWTGDMVTHPSGRFRATPNHRMLVRSPGAHGWKDIHAEGLPNLTRQFPVSGLADPLPVTMPSPSQPRSSKAARVRANSYHLRRKGMEPEAARIEASHRIEARDRLSYTCPSDLTDDECGFIGFWLGDGTRSELPRGGTSYSVTQSERYPKIVAWVDDLVQRLGYDCTRRTLPQKGNMTAAAIHWRFPKGTGFGPQRRSGLFPITTYLDKNGSSLLWALTLRQFDKMWEGLHRADGPHGDTGTRPSSWITTANYEFGSLLQAIAVCRGYASSLRLTNRATSRHRARYNLTISPRDTVTLGSKHAPQIALEHAENERIWCVTVPSGYIVTRRAGRVMVVGNTKGFDVPQVQCMIDAYPLRRALGRHIQKVGRTMRPFPGKTIALLIDAAGNWLGFRVPTRAFFDHGVDRLDSSKHRNATRNTNPESLASLKCHECGFVWPERANDEPPITVCPLCGAARKRARRMLHVAPGTLEEIDVVDGNGCPLPWEGDWWPELCAVASAITADDERAGRIAFAKHHWIFGRYPQTGTTFARVNRRPNPVVEEYSRLGYGQWLAAR